MQKDIKRVFSGINIRKNLKKASSIAVKYPLKGIEVVGEASNILEMSKGRDQICSLIQYIADFYYSCHKHSQIGIIKLLFLEGQIQSVIIAGKVRDSMKQGRKIFKFLKYLEEIKKFKNIYSKQDKQFIIISIFEYIKLCCKICSQFFDNILWGINIGVLSELVKEETPKNVKNVKDTFSLIGSILKIIITHIKYLENNNKEQEIFEDILKVGNKRIQNTDESYKLCLKYLKQREKKRDKRYRLFITLIRILMLTKRLKIYPLNKMMDGALYSFCGLFCTVSELTRHLLDSQMPQYQLPEYIDKNKKKQQQKQIIKINNHNNKLDSNDEDMSDFSSQFDDNNNNSNNQFGSDPYIAENKKGQQIQRSINRTVSMQEEIFQMGDEYNSTLQILAAQSTQNLNYDNNQNAPLSESSFN